MLTLLRGVKKVLNSCKGGSKKFRVTLRGVKKVSTQKFPQAQPPHQSIYEHSLMMTYNLPEYNDELQSEYILLNCFLYLCLLNDQFVRTDFEFRRGCCQIGNIAGLLSDSLLFSDTRYFVYVFVGFISLFQIKKLHDSRSKTIVRRESNLKSVKTQLIE